MKYISPIEIGHLMTMEKWLECVSCGGFIDYDGYGNYSDGTHMIRGESVYPSMVKKKKIDKEWSHIVWFNR